MNGEHRRRPQSDFCLPEINPALPEKDFPLIRSQIARHTFYAEVAVVLCAAARKRRQSQLNRNIHQAPINTPRPPYLRSPAPERIADSLSISSSPSNDRKVDMSSLVMEENRKTPPPDQCST